MIEAMHRAATSRNGSPAAPAADQRGARLDGLISMLSHDLRTPLSAISGWLFLLESGKLDAEAQKRAIAKIKASVEEQVQLIDDTLTISRSETGRVQIDRASVAVESVLEAALSQWRPQAEAKRVELDGSAARSALVIEADAARLQRAIELLLAHALRSTPAGGRISLAAIETPEALELTVTDTGSGVAAAELPYVLDPFRAGEDGSPRSAQGVERGLLLAQALVVAHGGTLSLASDGPGTGQAFTIKLPRAPRAGATP